MKILKKIGIGLALLLILLIVLAFVMPTEHSISVDKSIDGQKIMLFNAINDLRAHEVWNPWQDEDESMIFTLGEKLVGEGASYSWTSEKMGDGIFTISESDPETGIKTEAKFDGRGQGNGIMTLSDDDGKTACNWTFSWTSGRFTNIMAPIMKMGFKRTLRRGLNKLETLVQKRKKTGEYFGYHITQELTPEQYYVTKRSMVDTDKIQQFFGPSLGSIFTEVQKAGATMNGKASRLIYNYRENEAKIDIAAALPVSEDINISDLSHQYIDARNSVTLDFYGDIKNIAKAHDAIQAYMTDRELVHDWPIIETPITDQTVEQDPNKWLTKITYPIGN